MDSFGEPFPRRSHEVAERFNIDIQDLRAPLDVEETSRIDVEDDYTLILVDVPTHEERNNKSYYVTIPLGIIVTDEVVVTTCLEDISLMDNFLNTVYVTSTPSWRPVLSFRFSIATLNFT